MLFSLAYSLTRFLADLCLVRIRFDAQLRAEVLALRHQLRVLERKLGRPRWQPGDRLVLACLSRFLPRSAWSALLPSPETLLRWHRDFVDANGPLIADGRLGGAVRFAATGSEVYSTNTPGPPNKLTDVGLRHRPTEQEGRRRLHLRLRHSAPMRRVLRHKRQALTLGFLAGLSVTLVMYAYFDRQNAFRFALAIALGTNLVIVIATYLIFNPLIEEVRTATTREHPFLDYDRFIECVANSGQIVCILTIWTKLLEDPYRKRFLPALQDALRRGVLVQILLLDPASTAAEHRGKELKEDVPRLIMANLRNLDQLLMDDLNEKTRQQLQVRIYCASPSVLYYRWDSRAYLSFFPMGKPAEDVRKLETFVTTPWADYVRSLFEDLWEAKSTRTLERHVHIPLVVCDQAGTSTEFEVNYVMLGSVYYIENSSLTEFVARHGIENLTAHVTEPPNNSANTTPMVHSLKWLNDLPSLKPSVLESFKSKYEHGERPIVFCLSQPAE